MQLKQSKIKTIFKIVLEIVKTVVKLKILFPSDKGILERLLFERDLLFSEPHGPDFVFVHFLLG